MTQRVVCSLGKLHGEITTYYPSGEIIETTTLSSMVLKQGKSSYYAPDGVKLKELSYRNDLVRRSCGTYYSHTGKTYHAGRLQKWCCIMVFGIIIRMEDF